jgi:chromosome segregation ATPase
MPSQDSLDRSIHNESGHGKTTAQIVRDLKGANAAMGAKTASMEAQFMNQLHEVSKKNQEKQRQMEEQLRQLNKQLAHLEAYKAASDSKLQEKDAALSKTKEESAFQRHTISDLKNQLYQLQSEMEEQEMDKRDDLEQLLQDNQEMARQMAQLQAQLQEYETHTGENGDKNPQDEYYRRQWQETKGELDHHRQRLTVTETNLGSLQQVKETLVDEHSQYVKQLQGELLSKSEHWKRRERDLQSQIESLEFTDSKVSEDLRMELEESRQTVVELQAQLDQYAETAAELAATCAQVRQDAQNQEQYRRDEAEDLRILHDAQEEEITKLRKDLDDSTRELELRDEELEEKDRELKEGKRVFISSDKNNSSPNTSDELEQLRKELDDSQKELDLQKQQQEKDPEGHDEDSGAIRDLEEQRLKSQERVTQLEGEVTELKNEYQLHKDAVLSTVDTLTKEKEETAQKLETLQKEKEGMLSNLKEKDDEFSNLKNHWEGKIGATKETETLRKEIESLKQRVQESVELEKTANEKVQELQVQLKELQDHQQDQSEDVEEVKQLQEALAAAKIAHSDAQAASVQEVQHLQEELVAANKAQSDAPVQEETQKELEELRAATLKSTESSEATTKKLKKQLREAQIALVALDDEKTALEKKHRELLSAMETKKEGFQREAKKQLDAKEEELQQVQQTVARVQELEAEKDTLEAHVKSLEAQQQPQQPARSIALPSGDEQQKLQADLEAAMQAKARLESSLQKLTEQKDALRVKLKDRDTTIAALVRSSISMEQKITSMESQVNKTRPFGAEEHVVAEGEVLELRKAVAEYKEKEPRITEEIVYLRRQLKLTKSDAKRWKRALQEDGSTGSEYRFQISMFQKEIEDNVGKVEERDRAIENLVNQSISQESHVRDLKTRISSLMKEVESFRGMSKNKYEDSTLKAEIRRLQQESEIFAGQIIEQDEEIQNLKQDLQIREEQSFALKRELSEVKALGATAQSNGKNSGEVVALKKKLEQVQTDLRARDTQLAQLKKELEDMKGQTKSNGSDVKKIMNLQAEIDELQDASESNRIELRDLRRQLWAAKEAAGQANDLKNELAQAKYELEGHKRTSNISTAKSVVDLGASTEVKEQLEEALANNKALEQKNARQLEDLRRLKNNAVDQLQATLKERDATIKELQEDSSSLNEQQVAVFQQEIDALRQQLQTKSEQLDKRSQELKDREAALEKSEILKLKLAGELADTKKAHSELEKEAAEQMESIPTSDVDEEFAKKNEALLKENEEMSMVKEEMTKACEGLTEKIENMQTELDLVRKEQHDVEGLRSEVELAKTELKSVEKSIAEAYEREMSALAMDRDVTIDGLRKDLAEARGRSSDDITEMVSHLKALEGENIGLREQFEVELQAKNQQIYALEHTLHAQEQIVEDMRAEMDQLQSGMEHATEKRRGEVEDLQQEVMQVQSRAKKQEREIVALKMQLEESKLEHTAEAVRLKDVITKMDSESPLAKTVAGLQNDDRMLEVRERLEQLKMRNTSMQEENLKLGGRLERAIIEIKSFELEKQHAEEMEKENGSLRRQVKELESILTRGRRPPASPARPAVDKENPVKTKDKSSKAARQHSSKTSGTFRGLFKKKRSDFPSDEIIKEEKEDV